MARAPPAMPLIRVLRTHLFPGSGRRTQSSITTAAYPDYAQNPPAISFMGRKTWDPGRTIQTFITATFGMPLREQASLVERIGEAMSAVTPRVREAMRTHPGFEPIGARMLFAWNEGLAALTSPRTHALGTMGLGDALAGLS